MIFRAKTLTPLKRAQIETKEQVNTLTMGKDISLIIEEILINALNESTKSTFKVHLVNISIDGEKKFYGLYSKKDLSETQQVSLCVKKGTITTQISLPKMMLSRLAKYFQDAPNRASTYFDCISFAHFLNDIPYEFNNIQPQNWEFQELQDETKLKTGDTILMATKKHHAIIKCEHITHFAIFLGHGLYLSKFGSIGPLIVTTLKEMKTGFGGNQVFIASPQKSCLQFKKKGYSGLFSQETRNDLLA